MLIGEFGFREESKHWRNKNRFFTDRISLSEMLGAKGRPAAQ
jgi:hypothetical protein